MTNKTCVICNEEIPNKPRSKLNDLGYSGVRDYLGKRSYAFCPKHTGKEIAHFIGDNKIGYKMC